MWPPERKLVDTHYDELPFPGQSYKIPGDFEINLNWRQKELIGFIGTWSALRKEKNKQLLTSLACEISEIWPKSQKEIRFRLPLMGRWGYLKNE